MLVPSNRGQVPAQQATTVAASKGVLMAGALLLLVLVWLGIAFIPASIADNKRHSFWGY